MKQSKKILVTYGKHQKIRATQSRLGLELTHNNLITVDVKVGEF